jgi:hypothetical protein
MALVRTQIGALRADVKLIKWMVGALMIGVAALIVGAYA